MEDFTHRIEYNTQYISQKVHCNVTVIYIGEGNKKKKKKSGAVNVISKQYTGLLH